MFRAVCMITAGVCLILFAILLISPATYVGAYGVTADTGATFMVRRASPMFAGLALMLWLGRNAPHSALRTGVGAGVALAFFGIALTGITAFLTGAANAMILLAAAGEMLIASAFLVSIRGR